MNPALPIPAREQAVEKLTRVDFARSLIQHNRELYGFLRGGVPVEWRDDSGETCHAHARVIDFRAPENNRFLAVRELNERLVHFHNVLQLAEHWRADLASGRRDTAERLWTLVAFQAWSERNGFG